MPSSSAICGGTWAVSPSTDCIPADDRVVAAAAEDLALDPPDGAGERVGGRAGVRPGEGLVGQQDRLAGHAREALDEDLPRHGRAHAQEDRPGARVAAGEAVGERQRVQVERVEDAVEHGPPERALLPVPGLLGDVGDVGNLLHEDDAVHAPDLRARGRRGDRPRGRQIAGRTAPRPGPVRAPGASRAGAVARRRTPRAVREAGTPAGRSSGGSARTVPSGPRPLAPGPRRIRP